MKREIVVLSLGGSIIVPGKINVAFLKKFRKLILDFIKKGNTAVIVCGGGKVAREYQKAAALVSKITSDDLDWVGIAATKLNAELVRALFSKQAFSKVISCPQKKIRTNKKIIIGSGSTPGFSSDLDAVLLAENFGAKKVVNLSNISYVYTKDPKKYKDAKALKRISWPEFKKIIGVKYKPGMNVPFDPVAARRAEKRRIQVIVMRGTNLTDFDRFLSRKSFSGTVIG